MRGAEYLVGTTERAVLGPGWVYDACGDSVYASALASTIITGGGEAEEYFEENGHREYRKPSMTVTGSAGAAIPAVIRQVVDGGLTRIVTTPSS